MEVSVANTPIQGQVKATEVVSRGQQDIGNTPRTASDIQHQVDPGYQPTMSEKMVIKAIEEANKKIEGGPREFEFSIHEKTKQIMVKVVNTDTKEVIREIPPEKILDMVVAMCEQAGLFVDEKR